MTRFQVRQSPFYHATRRTPPWVSPLSPATVHVLRDPTHGGLATEIGGARILDLPFVERLPRIC